MRLQASDAHRNLFWPRGPLSTRGFLGLPPGGTVSAARPRKFTHLCLGHRSHHLCSRASCHQDFLVLSSSNYILNCQNHGTRCACSSLWSQTLWWRSLLGTRVISARAPVRAVTFFGSAVFRAARVIAFVFIIYLPFWVAHLFIALRRHHCSLTLSFQQQIEPEPEPEPGSEAEVKPEPDPEPGPEPGLEHER